MTPIVQEGMIAELTILEPASIDQSSSRSFMWSPSNQRGRIAAEDLIVRVMLFPETASECSGSGAAG